jgi:hypothetical protein
MKSLHSAPLKSLNALKSVAHTEAGKNWGMLFRADFLRGNVENLKILKLLEPM